MNTDAIRDLTLWARGVLTQEAGDLLRAVYGLKADGTFFPAKDMPALQSNTEAAETRRRLEQWIADEKDAEVRPAVAVAKLLKEVAFTHLNRLVALKMLEHAERRVVRRAALAGYPEPNGFRMYLPDHEDDYKLYHQGTAPLDELSESPRDRAYRHFLLWQYGELAKEVRVLFDPDNLASRLFPRPKVLRQIIERLNTEVLQDAWRPGNEETIGWVYQFFIAEEKAVAFKKVFKDKKKFLKEDIPAATQVFTPRWVVTFLVQNSLGRLWLSMHPDSALATQWEYLVPPAGAPPVAVLKSVSELRLLDPATGTMHFGLVAFDLLISMYREEMANAGNDGWPKQPPVARDEDVPTAILANNLFGIDIDLRAVQLSALALYVRAKAHHRDVTLTESNLACADVTMFRGPHRNKIAAEMALPRGLNRELFDQFCDALDDASMMGSLVRLERPFQEKLRADELKNAIDAYVRKKAAEGVDESYFGSETAKGLRLLDLLTRRYDVVFTNPPYMSTRNMNSDMSAFMKRNYRNSKGDLYSGFIERCAELANEGGRVAMITQQSFMFISSYEDLRGVLLDNTAIETMAHVGPRAFDEVQGEKVNTTAFVLRLESFPVARRDSVGIYFRLVKEPDADAKRLAFQQSLAKWKRSESGPNLYQYRQGDFAAIPGSPWVYWITSGLRTLFKELPQLRSIADPKIGMRSGDNQRFLRFWWEVGVSQVGRGCSDSTEALAGGKAWFPYMKGGNFNRWYGNQEYVVPWSHNGAEIKANTQHHYPELGDNLGWKISNESHYFRRGVTYSYLTAGSFSARLSPGGFLFDVAGSSLFPDDVELVLAVLNSSFAHYALKLINPTVNFQVGDLARLPIPRRSSSSLLDLVGRAVCLAKADSEEDNLTYDFINPPTWPEGETDVTTRHQQLAALERQIDEEVYRLYEISDEDRKAIEAELAIPTGIPDSSNDGDQDDEDAVPEREQEQGGQLSRQELAARWISYAVGIALGRFHPGVSGSLGCSGFAPDIAARLRDLGDPDGIMVLEEGHPDDLAQRVISILSTIYGDAEAERIVRMATESAAALRAAVAEYLTSEFFRDHVKRHRKRPVYWLIQSPKRNYSIYLFHERATPDTLPLLRGKRYLRGQLNLLQEEEARLNQAILKGDKGARRRAGEVAELIEDLEEFDRRIEAVTRTPAKDKNGRDVTVRWEPEPDDGVYINAAPLYELLPSWRDVNPKKAWQELAAGEYDWSHTAMRYWPQRVLAKCKENKSYAIAHGLA